VARTIEGTNDVDDLVGGGDSDLIFGYAGDDRLSGGANNDSLFGHAGFDQLFGGEGNDGLEGGLDADFLDGGEGTDTALYWNAGAGVVASLAAGLGSAGEAAGDRYLSIERLFGSRFDDVLEGDDGANTIAGLDGDDVIRGLGGNDDLDGQGGDDVIDGGAGADFIDGGAGFDYARYDNSTSGVTVSLAAALNGVAAVGGDATGDKLLEIEGLVGSAFVDSLTGDHLANDLQGGAGDDVLTGLRGNDTLDGGEGSDQAVFSGSRGNYLISFDASTDVYTVRDLRTGSADGIDHVRNVETFVFADGAVAAGALFDGYPAPIVGNDDDNTLDGTSNDDYLSGLGGNDVLSGLGGADLLDGGAGDDTLDGGSDIDTAVYALAAAGVSVSLAVTSPQDTGGAGVDTLISIENVIGSDFDDRLAGDAGANVLRGLAGNDTLLGGSGDDILVGGVGGDWLDGGEGFDFVSYETEAGPPAPLLNLIVIDLSNPDQSWGEASGDRFVSIEGVIGSNFNDFILGRSDVDETLIGGAGDDLLIGQGGADTLIGGAGDDLLMDAIGNVRFEGGDGRDAVSYSHGYTGLTVGVTADLSDPSRNTGVAAGDAYDSIENLMGSVLDDMLVGDTGNNALIGSYGNDRLIGGAGADILNGNVFFNWNPAVVYEGDPDLSNDGFDVASYETAASGVTASLRDASINTGDAAGDTYVLIEGLAGSVFDDILEGDRYSNRLEGGAGNDILIGTAGDWNAYTDTLDGGEGYDTAVLAAVRAAYTITFDATTGTYTLSSNVDSARVTNIEALQFADGTVSVASLVVGDNNDNVLMGTDNADDISGAGGDDTLEGFGGDDRIDGSDGFDLASYAHAAAAVRVDLGISGAQDTGGSGTDTLLHVEGLIGSAFDDTLIGNSGDNILLGGAGNDVLIGLLGTNTFDGGAGSDTVSYAASWGGVTVDLTIGGTQPTFSDRWSGIASDTLVGIENVIGSDVWGDTLMGDGGANRLTGGAGNDVLMGRGGGDILDGGAQTDTASYAEAATGVTVDLAISGPQETGEGADTLIGIENLTGSAFADTLDGDSGWNHLIGGGGNDILMGRGGNNILDGGEGVDTVSYTDALAGVTVELGSVSGSHGSGDGFDTLIGIENIVGSAFADVLAGDAEANALSGGAGNDRLTGGLGRDTLTGGAGADVFDYNALAESTVGVGARDIITDFQGGLDDIDLSTIDANTARGGDQSFRFIGTQAFRGREGELRYQTFDQDGTANDFTIVSGDINGDRVADFEIQIFGIVPLASGDFLL
jgi:Ca2+-binding RTX toxin-like protein